MQSDKSAQFFPGDHLFSGPAIYRVESILGQCSFGTVTICTRMIDMETVAIKSYPNQFKKQAQAEVAALERLRTLNPDNCNIVRWYQVFTDKGHICLEFEHLDKNLSDFMRERHYQPLPLRDISLVVQQLATALDHLKAIEIIHGDLKMENVMLVNHQLEPYRVKIIDFGLAHHVSAARVGSHIQTRPYRSPEIILGLPFTEAIDMWSLGCMAALMYLGTLLYQGKSEFDIIRFIVETQGQPPDSMLSNGSKTKNYFQKVNSAPTSFWKLKTPEQFQRDTGMWPVVRRGLQVTSLDELVDMRSNNSEKDAEDTAVKEDAQVFVDMLKGMLQIDPTNRITPSQLLSHRFISMCYTVHMYPLRK